MTKVNTILNEILKVITKFYSVEVVTDVTLYWDFFLILVTHISQFIFIMEANLKSIQHLDFVCNITGSVLGLNSLEYSHKIQSQAEQYGGNVLPSLVR